MNAQLEMEIGEDLAAAPPEDLLKKLVSGAERLRVLIAHRDECEAKLKEAEANVFKLQNEQLPALFDSIGVKQITLQDGSQLQRSEEIYASCARERQPMLAQWCEANGYQSIVKGAFTVPIGKGDTVLAHKVEAALRYAQAKFDYARSVHPSTLRAFVKERVREAQPIPDMISYHIQPTCGWHSPKKETGDGE